MKTLPDNLVMFAEAVRVRISDHSLIDWDFVLATPMCCDWHDASRLIAEPFLTQCKEEDAYMQFRDQDGNYWVEWIKLNFGQNWGQIANLINQNGY